MPAARTHMRTYKAFLVMLILVFSLSPCSVKRDVLSIFDIQYISGLNKVKITAGTVFSCDGTSENQSFQKSFSQSQSKRKNTKPSLEFRRTLFFASDAERFSRYSGSASGNSPPKYILFKSLRLNLV
ncbi:hypothetical protein [Chryseobacterium sp.]|jgi:hypothetical protein|uniref:hypothetical protein n=1 Tax=Chryseobacterium sp. TaxID=1871047 RepID=UPI002852AF1C|nr:hypothetical protein [Chryseobacterium sp.]